MASEVIGVCQRCGKPMTYMPELGAVSVTQEPDHVRYEANCPGRLDGHLLRLNIAVPGLPDPVADWIGQWAINAHEAELRKRNRKIAEAHQKELAEHRGHQAVMGEWHEGTCKGCGMDDLPVIGVPGSEYCRNCEDLRTLFPKPPELPPVIRPPRTRMLASSVALAMIAMLLLFANAPAPLCAGLLALAFVMGKAA